MTTSTSKLHQYFEFLHFFQQDNSVSKSLVSDIRSFIRLTIVVFVSGHAEVRND
jgi:hypothetical protein